MPMERSVSCAERGSKYGGGAGMDVRSYSASYARPQPPRSSSTRVQRARSVSAWARPAPPPVQRTGSAKTGVATAGRPTLGLNLRSYSASYAASYGPTLQVDGGDGAGAGQGQLKRSGSVTNWTSANRRSVNLRGYTPSFAALDDTAAAVPAPRKAQDGAELQRRKRLVVYKTYDVEGKVRESVRRSVNWIKGKCSGMVYGWW
ncbi:hypothetical protein BDA96_04G104100 [Sorghum bicolor]|uniref:Uncharacterized protein n=3 Tax=Sorghum bicolor TaxID=4558 RepID=A0A921R4A6_SORBI|nr:hypothetical protein BDA96_04G104100 [Sorghum bicolor]OQU84657.1 hypothetical protein SORBI_3004G096100 [Sorghum bicolor]